MESASALLPHGSLSQRPVTSTLRECLAETAALFREQFDRNWLHLLMEQAQLPSGVLSEVRQLVDPDTESQDPTLVARRVTALEEYVQHLQRHILPGFREKLGVSGMASLRSRLGRDQLLLRGMLAYTFPHNLERLGHLTARLRMLCETVATRKSA